MARALTRQYAYRIERDWCSLVDVILHDDDDEKVLAARKNLRESLISIAPIFVEKPFFMSDEFSMVDIMLAPILWRLPQLRIELPGFAARRGHVRVAGADTVRRCSRSCRCRRTPRSG